MRSFLDKLIGEKEAGNAVSVAQEAKIRELLARKQLAEEIAQPRKIPNSEPEFVGNLDDPDLNFNEYIDTTRAQELLRSMEESDRQEFGDTQGSGSLRTKAVNFLTRGLGNLAGSVAGPAANAIGGLANNLGLDSVGEMFGRIGRSVDNLGENLGGAAEKLLTGNVVNLENAQRDANREGMSTMERLMDFDSRDIGNVAGGLAGYGGFMKASIAGMDKGSKLLQALATNPNSGRLLARGADAANKGLTITRNAAAYKPEGGLLAKATGKTTNGLARATYESGKGALARAAGQGVGSIPFWALEEQGNLDKLEGRQDSEFLRNVLTNAVAGATTGTWGTAVRGRKGAADAIRESVSSPKQMRKDLFGKGFTGLESDETLAKKIRNPMWKEALNEKIAKKPKAKQLTQGEIDAMRDIDNPNNNFWDEGKIPSKQYTPDEFDAMQREKQLRPIKKAEDERYNKMVEGRTPEQKLLGRGFSGKPSEEGIPVNRGSAARSPKVEFAMTQNKLRAERKSKAQGLKKTIQDFKSNADEFKGIEQSGTGKSPVVKGVKQNVRKDINNAAKKITSDAMTIVDDIVSSGSLAKFDIPADRKFNSVQDFIEELSEAKFVKSSGKSQKNYNKMSPQEAEKARAARVREAYGEFKKYGLDDNDIDVLMVAVNDPKGLPKYLSQSVSGANKQAKAQARADAKAQAMEFKGNSLLADILAKKEPLQAKASAEKAAKKQAADEANAKIADRQKKQSDEAQRKLAATPYVPQPKRVAKSKLRVVRRPL